MLSAISHANIVAVWAKKISQVDCRLAVSIRNTLSVSVAGSPKPQDSLIPFLSRVFYPHADAVTAVSRGVADDLAESTGLPRRRIHVIYNPVVSSELLRKAHQSVEHGWLSESTGSPVILAVGRLTEQKDYPTLIKAFARVRAQRPARLLILGQGPDLSALKTFVEDLGLEEDVEFAGFVDNPYAYMKRADLYVLSSRWEGLPGTLIEAMACGVPVVATDCPSGPSEILEDGKWGRLVPVGDEHALADAVLQTLDDPDPPDVEARAADFGLEQAVNEYLNVLLPER